MERLGLGNFGDGCVGECLWIVFEFIVSVFGGLIRFEKFLGFRFLFGNDEEKCLSKVCFYLFI